LWFVLTLGVFGLSGLLLLIAGIRALLALFSRKV